MTKGKCRKSFGQWKPRVFMASVLYNIKYKAVFLRVVNRPNAVDTAVFKFKTFCLKLANQETPFYVCV